MSKNKETANSPALKRSWFQGLKGEFGKITWPTKETLAKKSLVAMIVSIILGLIIVGVDNILEYAISLIIG